MNEAGPIRHSAKSSLGDLGLQIFSGTTFPPHPVPHPPFFNTTPSPSPTPLLKPDRHCRVPSPTSTLAGLDDLGIRGRVSYAVSVRSATGSLPSWPDPREGGSTALFFWVARLGCGFHDEILNPCSPGGSVSSVSSYCGIRRVGNAAAQIDTGMERRDGAMAWMSGDIPCHRDLHVGVFNDYPASVGQVRYYCAAASWACHCPRLGSH